MTTNAAQPPSLYCPLCEQRLPDTTVYYDEVMSSKTTVLDGTMLTQNKDVLMQRSHDVGNVASKYTNTAISADGELRVCAPCAARYNRSVTLRARSRPLLNWGIIALVVSIVVTILTLRPNGSPWEALALAPLLVAVGLFLTSVGARVTGDRLAQPMKRYLRGKRVKVPA